MHAAAIVHTGSPGASIRLWRPDWRSDLAANGPARFLDKFPDFSDRLVALCWIAHDPAFAHPLAPRFELRLTSATSQAPGAARLKATGSTRVRLMKLTSATIA